MPDDLLLDGATDDTASTSTPDAALDAAEGSTAPAVADKPVVGDDDAGQVDVPETYEAFSMPEGVTLSEATSASLSEYAKSTGLTQDHAQKVADLVSNGVQEHDRKGMEQFKGLSAQWAEESKGDSEIGGADFQANLTVANKAMNQFADQDFKDLLNNSGAGNHPAVIRTFNRIGKMMGEANLHFGEGSSESSPDKEQAMADRLYK